MLRLLGLLLLCEFVVGYNITYDRRSLMVDGKRQLLISGCIHYPRSTPAMWPDLIAKAKAGGLNTIQTYVFWNAHQPTPDTYDFTDNLDLPQFLRLCQEAGMWVNLRIGPYVCAEWNLGGFPEWLLEVPGIEWRTNNPAFEAAVAKWVTYLVRMLQSQKMFASQGGPIILAQIENEYGNVQNAFPGHTQYVQWCANFAQSLNISVPWIMCQQSDAPAGIINTCNGFYCDGFEPNSPSSPKMWTENWPGWFQNWGQPRPRRPAEDVAFAAARFYARGGSYQNYYMYHGGTNFGRWVGGPNIVTSYDYDVQLDEYGLEQEPKYSHTARLHSILQANSAVLLAHPEPPATPLGQNTEAHVYGQTTGGPCFAFLSNYDSASDHQVTFNGAQYNLPAWSVSLLPDCKTVQYNTAQIAASAKRFTMRPVQQLAAKAASGAWQWDYWTDSPGVWGAQPVVAASPLEQIRTTHDTTDYLWYVTYVQRSAASSEKITVSQAEDVSYIYVNGKKLDSDTAQLQAGNNTIAILTMTMGLINYGAQMQSVRKGLLGKVTLNGVDITQGKWYHQVGLKGENEQAYNYNKKLNWQPFAGGKTSPLTWYHTTVPSPADTKYLALDLSTLNKGAVWINGHHLGRYSLQIAGGDCDVCDYRGNFNPSKCREGCGVPSQQWYHCPPGWLQPTNEIVILDETGNADLSGVQFVAREIGVVCSDVGENYPAEDLYVQLECTGTQTIKAVQFASFGTPAGYCRRFQTGTCNAANSTSVVEQRCLNKQACAVPATVAEFGDPCPSVTKRLAVQVQCG